MEDSGDMMINLLVKAPDQQISDQIVKCQLGWTVERLKEHLEDVYPTKPKRCDQKVIFSGQLLSDTMVLQDVLPQHFSLTPPPDNTYIVHLVCPLKTTINNNQSSGSSQVPTSTVHTPDTLGPSSTIQQYYSQLNSQQMAWMQQAYAHYWTQYMHLMNAQGIQLQSNIPYVQSTNVRRPETNTSPHNSVPNPANREEGNEDNNAAEQEVDEAGALANNAGEEREPGVNRDWLDVFEVVARVVVLSSIVYFYSSPSRFLVVTFLGFAIYLIQGGFLRGQPAFVNDNGRVENENVPENEAGPPPESLHTRNVEPTQDLRGTNPNEENERPGPWTFTWTFFTSFFTSLIPEQQPVL